MVFVTNTLQYMTILLLEGRIVNLRTGYMITFFDPKHGTLWGFSSPEQGGKLKRPVAHTCLIKIDPPPPAQHVNIK